MKNLIIITVVMSVISYLTVAFIQYDIVWIISLEEWSNKDRVGLTLFNLIMGVVGLGFWVLNHTEHER